MKWKHYKNLRSLRKIKERQLMYKVVPEEAKLMKEFKRLKYTIYIISERLERLKNMK